MEKVWIVEAQFKDGTWGIASFVSEDWASRNYYQAHKLKRAIQVEAKRHNKHWTKNRFRVCEYSRRLVQL